MYATAEYDANEQQANYSRALRELPK